ncbi:UNVERIFIED_ORG: ABC-type antimicrobial peptide transport system ATPase subunit [Peribacillus simplex]
MELSYVFVWLRINFFCVCNPVKKVANWRPFHDTKKAIRTLEFSDLPEDTNITYIKSSVPQKVYQKDGKAFTLQAYIVVSDSAASNEDALDFGFISTPVK